MNTPNTPNAAERPSVDALANFIRASNGYNTPGADRLAERIYEWLDAKPSTPGAVSDEDVARAKTAYRAAFVAGCPGDAAHLRGIRAALESFAKRGVVSTEEQRARELARKG